MKVSFLALALMATALVALVACSQEDAAPPKQPDVEVKTMEEVGKLPPEQEAAQLRQNDQRPPEDKSEGGI